MLKKRIAIQLYGHLRCFEKTYKSLFKNVISANNDVCFDIFIHTWDEVDAMQNAVHYPKDMSFAGLKLSHEEIENVRNAYGPKAILIQPQVQLENSEINFINKNGYNLERGLILKNMAHTFCSVNKLRRHHEDENGFKYDLIITSRPDIEFIRPLLLQDFYNRKNGWEFFESLEKNIFTTYINGISSVISQKNYLAGIDLLLIASSSAMDILAKWEEEIFDVYKFGWAELSLTYFANKYNLFHNYIYFEKDKNWAIRRTNESKKSIFGYFANFAYKILLPLLIKSDKFCQDIYLNTTKYSNNKSYIRKYLYNKRGI